jgi:hypothetical protein
MSEEDVAVVRGYREATDLEGELSFFAEDVEWIRPGRRGRRTESRPILWLRSPT